VKERLTGAIILVALLVLLVPELLTGPSEKPPATPAVTEGAPLRSYTIDLQNEVITRQPPSAPATAVDDPAGEATSESETESPPVADVTPPVEDATRASGRPMGSGADALAASSDNERAAAAGPGTATSPAAQDERPHSAFGPSAATRMPAEDSKSEPARAPVAKAERAKAPAAKAPVAKAEAPRARGSKGWAVQLGVFANHDNAQRLAKQVKGSGYPVVINETYGNGRKLYRVRVGPEADRAAAVALRGKLRAAGHAGTVVAYP
jgi:DedD protein